MSASLPCPPEPDAEANSLEYLTAQLAQFQATIQLQKTEFETRLAAQESEIKDLREALTFSLKSKVQSPKPEQVALSHQRSANLVQAEIQNHLSPNGEKSKIQNPTTRRRLLKRLGGIVAGAALIGATTEINPVSAADPVGDDALRGIGINNRGIRGTSEASDGVYGESTRGYGGVFKGGQAPLRLIPASVAGAPTTGTHQVGELWLDASGKIWVCAAAGTFGTANAPIFNALSFEGAASSNRAASNFVILPQPVRLIGDGKFAELKAFSADITDLVAINNSAATFEIAGKAIGNTTPVPSGAKAVAGVAVAISPRSNGNLRVYAATPVGSFAPQIISINYRINLTLSSYVTTALSSDGKVAVATSADCFFTFDVVGYYL